MVWVVSWSVYFHIVCELFTVCLILLIVCCCYLHFNIENYVLNWNLMKQSVPLHSNGFCTSMVSLSTSWANFPSTERLVAKVGCATLKTLVCKSITCASDFLLCSTVWGNWCLTLFFLFLSSLPFLSSQPLTILLSYSSVSVQLAYNLASSGKVMKRHIRLLSGCTVSSKLCAYELSS